MKISLIQPEIIRGSIIHNLEIIQSLVNKAQGSLMILAEYGLTGSLVLDENANIEEWTTQSEQAKSKLLIPTGKQLLINSLVKIENEIYNCCELLPTSEKQAKLFPDESELKAGIKPGQIQQVFSLEDKKFKVVICTDLRFIEQITTDGLDFLCFIFHFTLNNYEKVIATLKEVSQTRKLPILTSSLVSDQNIGESCYINGEIVVALPRMEGILEIEIC